MERLGSGGAGRPRGPAATVPTLALGAAGGALAFAVDFPLAWMLGALFACLVASLAGAPLVSPGWLRPPMAMLLGLALGASFTPETLDRVAGWWPSLALMIPYLVAVALLGRAYFRIVGGYDRPTAFYAAIPGGLSEMLLLSQAAGADIRRVALAHAGRILATVTLVPLGFALAFGEPPTPPASAAPHGLGAPTHHLLALVVAGVIAWRVAERLRLPVAPLLGGLLVSVPAHVVGWTDAVVPPPLLAVAQIVIGSVAGCRFLGTPPSVVVRIAAESLGFVALSLGVATAAAALLAFGGIGDFPAIVLAYAPGGMTELGLLALVLGIDAAFVATHQLARLAVVIAFATIAGGGRRRGADASTPNPSDDAGEKRP
ncbi:AbrB family transcriptional regulator [Salinarimonas rosea]|uniref:AbrB family transcriptional regulator n=1 Tax=Salinarimonas rosea TaxID=552063 RepID=UPI0003F935A0|nr:AbrB family transcriptional regulator [Salinarimonas rosea]